MLELTIPNEEGLTRKCALVRVRPCLRGVARWHSEGTGEDAGRSGQVGQAASLGAIPSYRTQTRAPCSHLPCQLPWLKFRYRGAGRCGQAARAVYAERRRQYTRQQQPTTSGSRLALPSSPHALAYGGGGGGGDADVEQKKPCLVLVLIVASDVPTDLDVPPKETHGPIPAGAFALANPQPFDPNPEPPTCNQKPPTPIRARTRSEHAEAIGRQQHPGD